MAADQERVTRAGEAVQAYEITRRRTADLQGRERELRGRLADLADRHAAEQRDVDRLEGLSLTRVLVALRGTRAGTLDRERAEADQARYRLAEAQAQLAAVAAELAAARTRLDRLAGAPAEFAAALADHEEHLQRNGDPRARPLGALAGEQGRLTTELREIAEADRAAERAANALAAVQKVLRSADGWSTYDTFLGGGIVSSLVKHDRLDEAARAAAEADRCLAVLRTELADVDGLAPTGPHVAVAGTTRFVDVWLDNVFTDFAVRDRIRQARHTMTEAQQRVAALRRRLAGRAVQVRDRSAAVEAERRALLVDQKRPT